MPPIATLTALTVEMMAARAGRTATADPTREPRDPANPSAAEDAAPSPAIRGLIRPMSEAMIGTRTVKATPRPRGVFLFRASRPLARTEALLAVPTKILWRRVEAW